MGCDEAVLLLIPFGGRHSWTLISNVSDTVTFRRTRSVALKDKVSRSTVKAAASTLLLTWTTSYSVFCAVAGTGSMKFTHGLWPAGEGTGPASKRLKSKVSVRRAAIAILKHVDWEEQGMIGLKCLRVQRCLSTSTRRHSRSSFSLQAMFIFRTWGRGYGACLLTCSGPRDCTFIKVTRSEEMDATYIKKRWRSDSRGLEPD